MIVLITHGKTLIRTVSSLSKYYGFIIPFPQKVKNEIIGVDRVEIFNTDEYFTDMYHHLAEFCNSIREIIPKKYQFYQHKNQLDFKL